MMQWAKKLKGARFVEETKFALGAALVWAASGTVHAFFIPSPQSLSAHLGSTGSLWVRCSWGFGFGWWGGLLWSVALALSARRTTPPVSIWALFAATYLAAFVQALTTAALRIFDVTTWTISIVIGIVVATVCARIWLLVQRAPAGER